MQFVDEDIIKVRISDTSFEPCTYSFDIYLSQSINKTNKGSMRTIIVYAD